MTQTHGFICSAHLYQYDGWTFEYGYCGPWPIRKNGELFKRAGKKFYEMFERWYALPNRENYRIGGGCERF